MTIRPARSLIPIAGQLTVILLITGAAHVITSFSSLARFQYQFVYTTLFSLLIMVYLSEKSHTLYRTIKPVMYMLTACILLLVGSTGWYYSPFSFLLYLLIIAQSFFFPAVVVIVQAVVLASFTMIKPAHEPLRDFLTLLSLLSIIPVSFYLRTQYLYFKQAEKNILILEKKKVRFPDAVEEALDNAITRFSARLRESLSTIKLMSRRLDNKSLAKEADEALTLLKNFEEETTGKDLIKPKSS